METTWEQWWKSIQPTLQTHELFTRIYDLRLEAERDLATHEVVWAHGVAVGPSPDGQLVRQPLFVHPVRYELDDRDGSLQVVSTGPPRLEIDPFERVIEAFDVMKRIEAELLVDPGDNDVVGNDDIGVGVPAEGAVIERLSKVIAEAEYLPLAEKVPTPSQRWQFASVELLFHRPRPVRYEAYFRALGVALDQGYLPDTWSAILADEPTTAPISEHISSTDGPWTALDQRVFSPLPLNKQQLNILKRISHHAGVTVQGPPGTGKSYAIAALTSHFLAHGLRVLICAEKPHPLRVIREKMPEQLRELCVAVLGDDRAASRQLEASISAITAKVNAIDTASDQRRLDELDTRLDQIRRRLAKLRSRELEIRRAEQATVTLDGSQYGTADAGRYLRANGGDDWLLDDLGPATTCPISRDELAELITLTRQLGATDRTRHGPPLVPIEQLTSGAQLSEHWQRLDRAAALAESVAGVVNMPAVANAGPEHLQGLLGQLRSLRERLAWATGTQWAAIHRAMSVSEAQRSRWRQITAQLTSEADAALQLAVRLAASDVKYPPDLDGRDPTPAFAELYQRFADGRGLPRFGGGDLKTLVEAISVDGRRPRSTADLDLVKQAMARDHHRRRLVNLWHSELVPHGLPPLEADRPEDRFQTDHQRSLTALIELPDQSAAVKAPLARFVHFEPALDTVPDIERVIQQLQTATATFERDQLATQLEGFTASLAGQVEAGHSSVRALHRALIGRDEAAWDAATTDTRRLHDLAPALTRHAELVARLAKAAPVLAGSHRTSDPHYEAPQVLDAWRWRQIRHWLDGILALGDLATISSQIAEAEEQEQRLLAELVTQRAWLEMARRTTGAHRSALETWAQAMARIGKGTGKHAPRHRLTAQRAMRSAQNAVPVWIMSIAQAIDSFRPGEDTAFDIVIIDEASQAPLDTVAVLGLGQRVLVVGDDRQISPTNFTNESAADQLRVKHLAGIPDADGFDIRTSLYDTASRRFPGVIQLQEHFRCLPEIIAFSNDLSYEGRIDPLREHHQDPEWHPVRSIRVNDGYRDGMVNGPEAEAVVTLVGEVLDDPAFGRSATYPEGASIGIVAMVGNAQAKEIQGRLIEAVSIDEMEARRIRVGSPYEFQGDERDVIIISMLDAVDAGGKATGRAATDNKAQQAYNVAASRARDQLIVLHSFDPSVLSEGDLRRRLVTYAQNPKRASAAVADLRERCESKFERDILERLLTLPARVDAQYPVAGYRIDFTLTDLNGRRVAVECDGDSYHGIDQLRHDTDRQRILERVGWRFVRVRASEYYADPDGSFNRLVLRAQDHGLRLDIPAEEESGDVTR